MFFSQFCQQNNTYQNKGPTLHMGSQSEAMSYFNTLVLATACPFDLSVMITSLPSSQKLFISFCSFIMLFMVSKGL